MKSYKVSFWFGGNDESADQVVYVKTDKKEKREITALALKEVGTYPRTYEVLVEIADNVEMLHVVQITNSINADEGRWYHDRDGELYVVRYIERRKLYVTCHLLGNTATAGYIDPKFCTVVTAFQAEDIY